MSDSLPTFVDPTLDAKPSGLQMQAFRGAWWTSVQATLVIPVSFTVNLITARSLNPSSYGTLATYLAAYTLVLLILNFGISDSTIQLVAAAHALGDRRQVVEIGRRCAGFHIYIEAPLGAIAVVVALRHESLAVQMIGAIAAFVTMAAATVVVLMTALSRNAALAKLNFAVGLGLQLAVVTTAVQSHSAAPTFVTRLAVATAGPMLALIIAPSDIRRAALRPLAPRGWPPGFMQLSRRTVVASLVTGLVYSRCEIFVLTAFGDSEATGRYALAAGLAIQITAPVDAILGPLVPAAASLMAARARRAGEAVLRGTRLAGLVTAIIAMIAIPALTVVIPELYSGQFAQTGALFLPLALVSCLQSVLHPILAFYTALRRPRLGLAINGTASVVDIALVIFLVRPLGAWAAVIGNTCGQLISLVATAVVVCAGISLARRELVGALTWFVGTMAATAIGALTALALVEIFDFNRWLCAPLGSVAAVLSAALLLRRLYGVQPDDLVAVSAAMPRAADLLSFVAKFFVPRHVSVTRDTELSEIQV